MLGQGASGLALRLLAEFHNDPRYAGDLHKADLAWARHAASMGLSASEIRAAIMDARDLAKKGSIRRQREYAGAPLARRSAGKVGGYRQKSARVYFWLRCEMNINWRERIVIDPAIHHGEPCITGTRVPVSIIVGSIADGDTPEQIVNAYPQLTADDIKAALKFAAEAVNNTDFIPLDRAGRQ